MTAEVVLARSAIEAGSRSVEASGFRYSPGQRLKAFLLGIAIVATGALAAAIIGPAFIMRGLELGDATLPVAGILLNILPGVGIVVVGGTRALEGITGRKNRIREYLENLAA